MAVAATDNEGSAYYAEGARVDVSRFGDITVYDDNGEVIAWYRRDQVTGVVRD